MKIAYLLPGSGGSFYCGNCLRDKVFINALRATGHDIFMIPMYLPLSVDQSETDNPIFYGAVNIYLEQLHPLFKRLPTWLKRFLDSEMILKFAARQAGSTSVDGNEQMTISMLEGDQGKQAEDLDELIQWLKNHEKPDVIHLSNALLSGLAKKLKTELGCAVVCSLQDEDEWVDEMKEPYARKTWQLIEANAAWIDAFISVSDYYAHLITQRIQLPAEKIHVINSCISPDHARENKHPGGYHTIGYMSKINSLFGADILFEAFLELKKEPAFADLKLIYTGGFTDDFRTIEKTIRRKLKQQKLNKQDVTFYADLSSAGKKQFLESISLFCVPSRRKEAFGIQLLEAFAAKVPVIMPDHGGYPEIVRKSQAGLLFRPGDTHDLVRVLRAVLSDETLYNSLKANCHPAIATYFNTSTQTKQVLDVYTTCLQNQD